MLSEGATQSVAPESKDKRRFTSRRRFDFARCARSAQRDNAELAPLSVTTRNLLRSA